MNVVKAMVCGALLGSVGAGTASAAYFIEAENETAYLGAPYPNPAPIERAEGTGPFAGEEMSGDAYMEIVNNSSVTYQIPADTIAPGTYYLAMRSSSGAGAGLFVDRAASLQPPDGAFDVFALSYNTESGTPGVFGWDWLEDYNNSDAFKSITINAGEANTFRVFPANGVDVSMDLLALLDSNDQLPIGVPEPASVGLIVAGCALFMRRRV